MRNLALVLLLFIPLTVFADQTTVPLEDFQSIKMSLAENAKISANVLRDYIASAAQSNEFKVAETTDNSSTLRYETADFYIDVLAAYDNKSIKISYKGSSGLDYHVDSDGTPYISPRYNMHIRKLIASLGGKFILEIPGGSTLINGLNIGVPRDGFFTVHYYRKLKDWTGKGACSFGLCWGLYVWGDATSVSLTWSSPIYPKVFDDFGAIYYAKQNKDSDSNDLYYILHLGDTKDQCGNDMEWDVKKGTAIFVVEGDCNIYYDLSGALASPKYVKQ